MKYNDFTLLLFSMAVRSKIKNDYLAISFITPLIAWKMHITTSFWLNTALIQRQLFNSNVKFKYQLFYMYKLLIQIGSFLE
jgi:hypothetical protein